jgi:hypothetical protein
MSAHEPTLPELPADFEQRCTETYKRLEAGEPMTIPNIADQLGLPFEFLGDCLAVYSATVYGVPALVDPSRPITH